ncbi:MAG: alpha/beta hydrolase, partial [Candidatus Binatia bacterium]
MEGWAFVVDRVAAALRAGAYEIEGRSEPPAFSRLVGAGFSLGAMVILATQSAFGTFDAIVPAGWSHGGGSDAGTRCVCFDDCPDKGFRYFHAPNADPAVVDEILALSVEEMAAYAALSFGFWAAEGCSSERSARLFSEADFIRVPVLALLGREDFWFDREGMEHEASFYRGTADVELILFDDTGHHLFHHRNSDAVHGKIAEWLTARGF